MIICQFVPVSRKRKRTTVHTMLSVARNGAKIWKENPQVFTERKSAEKYFMNLLVTPAHKVRTYKEYHSVCPSSELGLSHPLSRQRVFPSPQKQGGGGTLACGWGVGGKSQFRRGAYTVVLFICTYFVLQPVSFFDVSTYGTKYCFLVSYIPFYAFYFFSRHLSSYSCLPVSAGISIHPIRSINTYLHLLCLCDMIVLSFNLSSFSL
jgi:hypothetical protein